FEQVLAARLNRRDAMKLMTATGAAIGWSRSFAGSVRGSNSVPESPRSRFTFEEISHGVSDTHVIAPGYDADVLIRWGDAVLQGAPVFDPYRQTPESQEKQFGYNNDYIGYLPLGPQASRRGLLCVNHEYADPGLMFPQRELTPEAVEIEQSAVGCSIIEITREDGLWRIVEDSGYARRISGRTTPISISGPAAGSDRLRTREDPAGTTVVGTISNCGGGVTPWGTCLVAEENFNMYFYGRQDVRHKEARNHFRYGISSRNIHSPWYRFFERWDANKILNESNRFGWIVEVDPFDASSTPVKRTALGRLCHEGAAIRINGDGRAVVYMADDDKFEYIYRFVSANKFDALKRANNFSLLDEGTLSVARFADDGSLRWIPLIYGMGEVNESNGFYSQADVMIEARAAADLAGATPMDRPEGIAISPKTSSVFVSLSKNNARRTDQTDAVNSRARNIWGQIVELVPPDGNHTAEVFGWEMLVQCGPPHLATAQATWNAATSGHGWFAAPDLCAFDHTGGFWVCTDQSSRWKKSSGTADGLWALETEGPLRATGKMFFRVPVGAELTGPAFTPDDETLFLSVQHPSSDGARHYEAFGRQSTFGDPATRWPDFDPHMPPRPAVVAVTKRDGGIIGS
ncbi:PhoX family phosphatase, partial [Gammaproteobacteria bacterium]|nr:PhoX family phosphatase [Gammaproteobacteria bacterium]